jgi:hypothetical protein
MAFNTPKFNTPTFVDNPPLLFSKNPLANILSKTKLDNQVEKIVPKLKQLYANKGFVDASFEATMKAVGWRDGQPWCAYYVKLVLMQLYSFDREWLSKNIGGGAVDNLYIVNNLNNRGDKRYIAITKNEKPQVGDVFCQGVSGNGHTGIIVEVLGQSGNAWDVKTIEGNTSEKGVREGYRTLYLNRTLQVGVASKGGSKVLKGYWRRNFTEQELQDIIYDESQGTFVKKGDTIFDPKKWEKSGLNPLDNYKIWI